ncbi:hypothetical protein NDU88_002625 [Pleurodeles waltl]|uniref:Uncharacterized protein n=1 Tax=Pleurodeles waltl TaxID=8319 RepID=A0AAV7M225_PLEWA|nr:hypothetical protein NDU88_002625 [Pleurodeles waltl]
MSYARSHQLHSINKLSEAGYIPAQASSSLQFTDGAVSPPRLRLADATALPPEAVIFTCLQLAVSSAPGLCAATPPRSSPAPKESDESAARQMDASCPDLLVTPGLPA